MYLYTTLNQAKSKEKVRNFTVFTPYNSLIAIDPIIKSWSHSKLIKFFGRYILSQRNTINKGATALLVYVILWYSRRKLLDQMLHTQYEDLETQLLTPKATTKRFFRKLEELEFIKREVRHIKRANRLYKNVLCVHLNIPKINKLLELSKESSSCGGGSASHSITDELTTEELKELQETSGISADALSLVIQDLRLRRPDITSSSRIGILNYILKTIQNDTNLKGLAYYLRNFTPILLQSINIRAKRTYSQERVGALLTELIETKKHGGKANKFYTASAFVSYIVEVLRDRKVPYAEAKTFTDFLDSATSRELQLENEVLKEIEEKRPDVIFTSEQAFKKYMLKTLPAASKSKSKVNSEPLLQEDLEQLLAEKLTQINQEAGRNFSLEAAIYLLRKLGLGTRLKFYTEAGFLKYTIEAFKREFQSEYWLAQLAAQSRDLVIRPAQGAETNSEQQSCTEWVMEETTPAFFGEIKQKLLSCYGKAVTRNWFMILKVMSFETGVLTLGAPTSFMRDWIVTNYLFKIIRFCKEVSSEVRGVDIVVFSKVPALESSQNLLQEKYLQRESLSMPLEGVSGPIEYRINAESILNTQTEDKSLLKASTAEISSNPTPDPIIQQLSTELIKRIGTANFNALQLDKLKYQGKCKLVAGGEGAQFSHESEFLLQEIQVSQGVLHSLTKAMQSIDEGIKVVQLIGRK